MAEIVFELVTGRNVGDDNAAGFGHTPVFISFLETQRLGGVGFRRLEIYGAVPAGVVFWDGRIGSQIIVQAFSGQFFAAGSQKFGQGVVGIFYFAVAVYGINPDREVVQKVMQIAVFFLKNAFHVFDGGNVFQIPKQESVFFDGLDGKRAVENIRLFEENRPDADFKPFFVAEDAVFLPAQGQ